MKKYLVTFANGTIRNLEMHTDAPVSEEVAKWGDAQLTPET